MWGSGMFRGFRLTGRRSLSKTKTELYPYVKKRLPPRSRIFLAMHADETGRPKCQACLVCQQNCPDHVIRIERDPEDRKHALNFTVNSGRCTFCGICVENCAYGALYFSQDFERAVTCPESLIYRLIVDGHATGEGSMTSSPPAMESEEAADDEATAGDAAGGEAA